MSELVRGCEACVAAHGARRTRAISDLWRDPTEDPTHSKAVNYVGVRNIIDACRVHSVQRIVRVTGKGETPWSFFSILINGLGSMAKAWNYEGENLLRASGLDYTIVRPGIMRADGDDTRAPAARALSQKGDTNSEKKRKHTHPHTHTRVPLPPSLAQRAARRARRVPSLLERPRDGTHKRSSRRE